MADSSTTFAAWVKSIHTTNGLISLALCQYKANGPIIVTLAQIAGQLGVPKTTLRDRIKALMDSTGGKNVMATEEDPDVLKKLKDLGAISNKAQSTTVVKLKTVIQAMEVHLPREVVQALAIVAEDRPPTRISLDRMKGMRVPKVKTGESNPKRSDLGAGQIGQMTRTALKGMVPKSPGSENKMRPPALQSPGSEVRVSHLLPPREATRERLIRMSDLAGAHSFPASRRGGEEVSAAAAGGGGSGLLVRRKPFKVAAGQGEYYCFYRVCIISNPASLCIYEGISQGPLGVRRTVLPIVYAPQDGPRRVIKARTVREKSGAPSLSAIYGQPFPTSLDSTVLHIAEMGELYGLKKDQVTPELAEEIEAFRFWSMAPVQLDRPGEYVRAVQTSTFDGQRDCLKGYFGFIYNYCDRELDQIGIRAYEEPTTFVSFVSFLKARGCHKAQLVKHISLAKKVNTYIASAHGDGPEDADGRYHHTKLQTCLSTLESQISMHMKDPVQRPIPDWEDIHAWVDRLGEGAKAAVRMDIPYGPLSTYSAIAVQAAVVTMLVTGRYTGAPCRISTIKSVIHPDFVGRVGACRDPDCLNRKACPGNHFIVLPASETEKKRVKFEIPHHKNDRHLGMAGAPIEFILPSASLLNKLLIIHIEQGHGRIINMTRMVEPHLFVDSKGRGMNMTKGRFSAYWKNIMSNTVKPSELAYFPPSLARKSFVEWYTAETGALPYLWDGAADIMGNSVGQWLKTYNPSFKKRRMQDQIDGWFAMSGGNPADDDGDSDLDI